MGMGQVANVVKKAIYPIKKHRIYQMGSTEGAGTGLAADTVLYNTLLSCDDDPSDDVVTNHSTLCECHPGAEILGIELFLVAKMPASIAHQCLLFKDRDAHFASTTGAISAFGTGDWDPDIQQLRKQILGFKWIYLTSASDSKPMSVPVSRAALARNRRMEDGDSIKLMIDNNSSGSTGTWWLFGSIYTRGPQ